MTEKNRQSHLHAGWNFDNSYVKLPSSFYTRLDPTPVAAPKLVKLNEALADEMGLETDALHEEEEAAVFAGNCVPEGAAPLAQAYAGHQFGHFTMLGDGRAILLGEQLTPAGERMDIQLKGSGQTPYSRMGDGRAGLGPMLREYIISEAMHALGIPTTRSLAVVTTGESIMRLTEEPGAVLTRVAASHLRVGTFQYAAGLGDNRKLQALADYAIERHDPDCAHAASPYLSLLQRVIARQAKLIAKWQLVGFIHGVMNTDNMTISGETIDYGPCAFMDVYHPETVFSSIDRHGRYAYGNQPKIASWNLTRFAESLLPLIHQDEQEAIRQTEEALTGFGEQFSEHWLTGMRAKLGLFDEEEQDESLIHGLLALMEKYEADFTNTFRAMSLDHTTSTDHDLFQAEEFQKWKQQWEDRLNRQSESREAAQERMRAHNPAVIPRNHRVEEALKAAEEEGDLSVMDKLLNVLAAPYAYSPEQESYTVLPQPSGRPYRTYCGT
ncbi:protein adenylyltransferase SelO [Marinicrinis sediminis]|uniref:Protein nucleotidyltransferase YdiU n=1 Tax=Marinicrinis sediminis TaxID=1652465 RepID=A0ABW5RDG4_9BACL